MDRDHRHVGKPGHRVPAGAVSRQRLQDERHRQWIAGVLDQHDETGGVGQPQTHLLFGLVVAGARDRPQRQSEFRLPGNAGCRPKASDGDGVARAPHARCQHRPRLLQCKQRGCRANYAITCCDRVGTGIRHDQALMPHCARAARIAPVTVCVVWAEIHVFRGRMYVTQVWGSTGVRVDDHISDARLGEVIVEQLGRPTGRARPGERSAWQVFCEDVAGVAQQRFDPEKRVRAFRIDGIWQVDAKPRDMRAPARLVDAAEGLSGLGAAVRRELASLEPRWPTIRRIVIMTTATRHLVVMPSIGGYTVGPAHVVEGAGLAEAVRAALADADLEGTNAPAYEAALAAAGVDARLLDGGARVDLEELSDGTIRLSGSGTTGDRHTHEPTWLGRIDALAEACAAAVEMIRSLPTQHLRAGTPTGRSFGYKCCWLAVRGSNTDEVADAVSLTGTRPVGWDEGVDAAYAGQAFVSPPTAGWVFVLGAVLPFDGRAVAGFSARLDTQVQYFGTHRVSEYHEWASAIDGRLVRRLRCEGMSGQFEQHGPPTPVEIDLDIPAMSVEDWHINEDTVMRVAAAWSIDPTTLHLVESSPGTGTCGTIR